MPKVTRAENEVRMAAVLDFFRKNPRATGADAQEELRQGRLTGKKEGPMGKKLLYRLQREATQRPNLRSSGSEPVMPREALPMLTGAQYAQLKQRASEVQALLANHGDILEVRITRDGARVIRATEAKL